MQERQPEKEDLFDQSLAFIRSHTKETIAIGAAGVGTSILGEKIDNDLLLDAGATSAGLTYVLLVFSWGHLWVKEALDDAIGVISKQIQKRKNKKN